MKKISIYTNIPPVDNFPKDDKLRVVWAYGAVYKNTGTTRVPEIYVMLKEIHFSGAISTAQIFRRISVAQLDIVRYMTIWKGNRRTTDFWKSFDDNYVENILFSLDTKTATSISFTEKRTNSEYGYFPPYRYRIDKIDNPKDYYSLANATFTKIEAFNGITVIVPSMELLTSTYVPQEQQIRYKLIQRDLDDVLDEYIKSSSTDGSKYMVELDEVQKYLSKVLNINRVEYLYSLISNPQVRVNSKDKQWVAYETQASENQTVIDAIKEILADHQIAWATIKNDAIEAINKTGKMFEDSNINLKPRIPFYVLVLDKILE